MDEFIEWVLSRDANLVPRHKWFGNVREAALLAILSKLIKNKSWNSHTKGHNWTIEEDLLGQSPVFRNDFQAIAVEARQMLGKLKNSLLVSKGGTAGTPKEWCIRFQYVTVAKRIILNQSFDELEAIEEFQSLGNHIDGNDEQPYRLDGEIVNEKVRGICQSTH